MADSERDGYLIGTVRYNKLDDKVVVWVNDDFRYSNYYEKKSILKTAIKLLKQFKKEC